MARYVDRIVLRVCDYDYPPVAENIETAWQIEFQVDARVDRERLVDEIEAILRPNPFLLDDRWNHHSCGAEGALLEIVIGLASGTGVLLIERLVNILDRKFTRGSPFELTPGAAADIARHFLAQSRGVSEASIAIEEVTSVDQGCRVILEVGSDRFAIHVDAQGNLHRLHKLRSRPPQPNS